METKETNIVAEGEKPAEVGATVSAEVAQGEGEPGIGNKFKIIQVIKHKF